MIKIKNLTLKEAAPVDKLSDRAASLLSYLKSIGKKHCTIEDIRMWPEYGGWRDTMSLLMELESRSIGRVANIGTNVSIILK